MTNKIKNTPERALLNVQNLLTQVRAELDTIDWNAKQVDDGPLGKHLVALEQHIDNAIGRCSAVATAARAIKLQ